MLGRSWTLPGSTCGDPSLPESLLAWPAARSAGYLSMGRDQSLVQQSPNPSRCPDDSQLFTASIRGIFSTLVREYSHGFANFRRPPSLDRLDRRCAAALAT